ncbi:type II toxin-antitoxin system death-on-curing family toxin [Paenibacillus solani]|uniref:type II toxin-antitoxin system death-on-curing family toxin n=1 Tax=Paenibacillus solani TaxID=1705565 RepID=UPI003D2963B2
MDHAYLTVYGKSAALFESLGQNHLFHNANKRTAFTALVIFLRYNGLQFKMDTKFAEDFMVNHEYSFEHLTEIIKMHCIVI